MKRAPSLCLVVVVATGCAAGGAAPPHAPPAADAPATAPAEAPASAGFAEKASPPPSPSIAPDSPTLSPAPVRREDPASRGAAESTAEPPAPSAQASAAGRDARGPALAGEEHRLTGLAREVTSAIGARDCPSACRALDSMERAAAQVCRLVTTGERDRCERARATARSAREQVMATCGGCPAR